MEKERYKRKFEEYFKHILYYNGYNVYDIEHSVERYNERIGKKYFLYEKLLKKGINYLVNNGLDDKEDRYIFISKKYQFGIQIHWRQDRNSHQFGGYTATTLSAEEMRFFTKKDKSLFLENILAKEKTTFSLANRIVENGYHRYMFEEELQDELDLVGYSLHIQSGNISFDFEIVEI